MFQKASRSIAGKVQIMDKMNNTLSLLAQKDGEKITFFTFDYSQISSLIALYNATGFR